MAVYESVGLAWFLEGDNGAGQTVIVSRQGCAKFGPRLQLWGCLAVVEDAGNVYRSQLLGVSLEPTAGNGKVLGYPNGNAAAVGHAFVFAAHHNKSLKVLAAHWIKQFCSTGAAALPVCPNDCNRAWLLVGKLNADRQQRCHVGRIG